MAGLYLMDFKEKMVSFVDFGWIGIGADDPTANAIVPFETQEENKSNLAAFGNVTTKPVLGMGARIES